MTRTALLNIIIGAFIGFAIATLFAWSRPPKPDDASLESLRTDYKSDYVVMVAQAYSVDSNLELAKTRLSGLKISNLGQYTADLTRQLIIKGAPPSDLRAMVLLVTALGGTPPALP